MRRRLRAAGRALLALTGTLALLAAAPSRLAAQVDLVLNVTDTPDPVPATGTVTYAVTIANNGVTTATGVVYTMSVPAGASYVGFTAGTGASCSGMAANAPGPGTITCSHPNIASTPDASFAVQLRLNTQGSISVTSNVTSSNGDADTNNNTVLSQTTVTNGADVTVGLTAPSPLASGSTFNYGLSVTNAGPDAATALRVQFPLPTGFTQSGGLPSGCSNSAGTIVCDIAGPIASGATFTIGNISGKLTAASGSTVTGSASVALQPGAPALTAGDPNTGNNTTVRSITVTAGSDLALTKTRSVGGPYFVGGTFNFILTPTYDGDAPTGLTITDVIPANYTVGAVAPSQNGWSCSVSGQTVTCTRASGGVAGSNQSLGTITIPVTIASAGTVTNSATITATSPTDPNTANNTATDGGTTLQLPAADLTLSKTGPNPALVVVGVPFTWTLTAANGGPAAFSGTITVTDNLPTGITVSSVSASGWTCSAVPVSGPSALTCSRTITSGAPLASGSSVPSIILTATATSAGALVNSATLTTSGASATDPNTGNNTATHTVTASTGPNSADLRVIKTVDLASVPAGDVLTYTVEVVNDGAATATSVTLTDDLQTLINNGAGATGQGFVSATVVTTGTASAVNCSSAASGSTGRLVTCTIPSLPACVAGSTCPRVAIAIRPGGDGGTRSNTASVVSSATADPNTANNSGTVASTIDPRADVTVTKTGTPNPVSAGQNLTYVVTALNNGPSAAGNVTINDTLPLNVLFVSASPASGSCSVTPTANSVTAVGNRIVTCNLGSINNGAQRTVTIVVRPTTATRGTSLTNAASVTTSTTEPTVPGTTNNGTSIVTPVSNPSLDLLINNIESVDPVAVSLQTVYTLTVNNVGPSEAENVVLTNVMPAAGLSYQSHTPGAFTCTTVPAVNTVGGTLTCSLPRLAAGASQQLLVTMQGVTKGIYTNNASVTSTETTAGFDVNTFNNGAPQTTTVRTRADMQVVSKTASAPSVALRRPFSWVIKVRNNTGAGLAEADTVRVTDALPSGMELTGTPTVALVAGTTTLSTCTGTAGQTSFTCDLGTVSSGGEVDITVPVRHISVPTGGTSTNSATVTTTSLDITPGNNTQSGSTTITASSIAGLVFRDFNNNAASDAGDTGMNGIGLSLSGSAFDGATITQSLSSDANGLFTFSNLPEGTYTITRGTVSETFLTLGTQTAGTSGGTATTPPTISAIALAGTTAATGYRFAFVPQARIALAKRVFGTPIPNADGSITAVLRISARNLSLETLNTVSIIDVLDAPAPAFGTFIAGGSAATLTAGSYTINTAPAIVGTCTNGTANAGFNGSSTISVLSVTGLAAGATCEVGFTLRYRPLVPLPPGNYSNQASGSGAGALSGQSVTDLSQDGTDPDPNNNGTGADNNVPTPLNAVLTADVTTAVTMPASANAGTSVSGTVLYRNLGPYDASGVTYGLTLAPNLTGVTFGNLPAGAGATYAAGSGAVTFTGMPASVAAGVIVSGNGTTGITVSYTQNATANSTVASTIATATNEGLNTGPNSSSATVTGALIADVTTTLAFPATVNAGQPVSGTLVYRNGGPSTASGMSYTLTLAANLSGVTLGNLPAGATFSYAAGTGVVTLTGMPATLANGAIASGNGTSGITVQYTQPASGTSAVSSTIATSTSQGANALTDAASANIGGVPIADVTTALVFPVSVNAGSTVSGTVLYRNDGPSTAAATTFTLTLTPGLTGVTFGNLPAGATATYNSGTGAVTFAGFPTALTSGQIVSGNGTSPITLSYTQPGSAVSTIASTIGTSTNQGANVGLDAASASPGGGLIADVRALVTAPTSVNAGQPVSAAVTFSNNGPSVASAVTYTLTLAPSLGTVTFSNLPAGASASYNGTNGVVTFTGMPTTLASGAIASGDGTTGIGIAYAQNATASSSITGTIGTSTNQGANLAPDSDTKTVGGALIADVTTSFSNFPSVVPPGSAVTGRLTFRNAGPSTASGITYALTLQAGLSGVTIGNLPAGATFTYNSGSGAVTFTGMPTSIAANGIVSGDAVNPLSVSYAQAPGLQTSLSSTIGTSTNQGTNTLPDNATQVVSGILGTNLIVRKTAAVTEVTPRDSITYTIEARNAGPVAVSAGTVLTDVLPSGLSLVSASCATVPGNVCTTPPGNAQLLAGATLPALAVNAAYTLSVRTAVTAPDGATLVNVARGALPFGFFDTDSSDNVSSAASILVRARPDLAVTRRVNVDTLRVGGSATYTATIVNRGTSTTTGAITMTETLPAALVPTAASGTGFTCTIAGQTVTCTRTTPITLSDTAQVIIATTVSPLAPQAPVAVTTCSSTPNDINQPNDCATVTTPVAGVREVTLRKQAVGEFVVGETGSWRLWVRNSGSVPLTGLITLTDTLPAGLTFTGTQGAGWSCSNAGGVVTCTTPGPIAVGDSTSVTLQTLVGAAAVPTVNNCATVAVQGGAVLANGGRSCASASARGDYRLVLELTTPRYDRELQDVPDFTVTVRNVGRSPLPDVLLTNLLPRGFTYVRGTSYRGGAPDPLARALVTDPADTASRITWPLGTLAAGAVARIDYRALIGAGASFGVDNMTLATARSSVVGLQVISNTARVPIRLRRGLFDNRGMIAGKVYVDCNCDQRAGQGAGELGVPGVRVLMEDGTGAITDVEGKFNFINVRAGLHVVKIDRRTLPAGATLVTLNTRNAGDAYSRFVDLKAGELARADFAEGSRDPKVLAQVQARRRAGEVMRANDSTAFASALDRPMTTGAQPPLTGQAPVLGGSGSGAGTGTGTVSRYVPLVTPNALHDGNSSLPPTPARAAAQQTAQPNTGAAANAVQAEPGDPRQVNVAPNAGFSAIGLLQGRLDLRRLTRGSIDLASATDGFEEALRDNSLSRDSGQVRAGARGALLLKGNVKGAGLLTLAYDTERDRERTQFRDITPDEGFTVFGDGSLREFDAQSQQRLYARLDRGASYLRYGDFATPRSDERRLLLAYDRSLTGLAYHGENTRAMVNSFASRNRIRQVVDELQGRGISGPYFLSRSSAVINSERVEILTRDRNQPSLILKAVPMARFEEYTVEPLSGRLLFRAPVPSLDANLNPVTIRVSYEVEQGGAEFMTYGGDARVKLASRVEVAGFAVRDENPIDTQTLLGGSVTALLTANTSATAEYAHTETGTDDVAGAAWRVEMRHQSSRVEARLFAMRSDTGFLNRSSTFTGGREEFGGRISTTLNAATRVIAEAIHTADVRTDGQRDGASLAVERRLTGSLLAEVGYRWARDNGNPVAPLLGGGLGNSLSGSPSTIPSSITPLSFSAARARLSARVPGSTKTSLFAEYEYGLDDRNARRGSIGGERVMFDRTRLYLRHEWLTTTQGPYALSEQRDQQNTVFGIDANYLRNGQVFSEYRARDAFNGRDAEASMGLRNRLVVRPGLVLNSSFERVTPLAGTTNGTTYAATGAVEWTKPALWKSTVRLEYRDSPAGDNLLGSLGYARKLGRDWTLLGRSLWDQVAGSAVRGRSQLGFAWRETDRNRVSALFRLENRLDQTDATGQPTSRTMSNVAAALLNLQPVPHLTISTRYAAKRAADRREAVTTNSSAQLFMARTIFDVSRRVDVGVIGSMLGSDRWSQRRYGAGGELGLVIMTNVRLATGYNVFGFTDRDFASLGYTQRGLYLDIGIKFDEALFQRNRRHQEGTR